MKKNIFIISLLVLLLTPLLSTAEDSAQIDLRDLMTQREFSATGLNKLSEDEIGALNNWLSTLVRNESKDKGAKKRMPPKKTGGGEKKGLFGKMFGGAKYTIYEIQEVSSDYSFTINDNRFDSTSICPGYKAGEEVIFTEGRANGSCDTAEFSRPDGSDRCEALCK